VASVPVVSLLVSAWSDRSWGIELWSCIGLPMGFGLSSTVGVPKGWDLEGLSEKGLARVLGIDLVLVS